MSVSVFCAHCHKHTALRMARYLTRGTGGYQQATLAHTNELNKGVWWIGICNGCQSPMLVFEKGEIIFPHPLPSPSDPTIPKELRADLDEAKMCYSVNCLRACAVLARRCVQNACILKGSKKRDLKDQIQELTAAGHITRDLAEWATVVRFIGNDGAHPNESQVTKEDAGDCLKLAEQFLHVLFVTPAIAQARKAVREKQSGTEQSGTEKK